MIPSLKKIQKKSKKIIIEKKSYFSLTQEFLTLQKKFVKPFFETLLLGIDMILYPLYVFYQLYLGDFSPFYIFGLSKAYELWIDYLRFLELDKEIQTWISIVKQIGGPWISTNNSDYHLFVYADAMERILLSRLTKKLSKRS
jgi:hypothetical protein